jgi:broad specificity phosphatase PhoE
MSRIGRRVSLTAVLLGCLALASVPTPAHEAPDAGATTVVVVRHAEKATDDPTDRDPDLVETGRARARALAEVLAGAGVDAAYVTQYRRTRLTAEPAAARFEAPVRERPCCDPGVEAWSRELAAELLTRHGGETVLVVGHSNTVPDIVEALSGHDPGPMDESEYDHLFLVVVPGDGDAPLLFESRFGEPSPEAVAQP